MHASPLPSESSKTSCADTARASVAQGAVRRFSSSELLAGQREIEIEHDGQRYRLRLTAQGKLILTK